MTDTERQTMTDTLSPPSPPQQAQSKSDTPEFVIETKQKPRPYVGLVYGCGGVGKTTLCSSIPGSIVIDLERGGDGLDCTRLTIEQLDTPRKTVAKIKRAIKFAVDQGYTTIIIDSITALEDLFERQYLLESNKLSLSGSAHGNDYKELYALVKEFLGGQTAQTGTMAFLAKNDCNLILIGHDKEKEDTVGDSALLNVITPRLYKGLNQWVSEQCDFVFYYTFDIIVREDKLGMSKEKLAATRGRKLITSQEGGIYAKNRYKWIKPVISNPKADVFTSIYVSKKTKELTTEINTGE